VETNDNGFYTASFTEQEPKKFELVYSESGFVCPPTGVPPPCALTQTPTVLIGELKRVKNH
jgi:hypothetical protein